MRTLVLSKLVWKNDRHNQTISAAPRSIIQNNNWKCFASNNYFTSCDLDIAPIHFATSIKLCCPSCRNVCKTVHHAFMVACIYTNTQTCTDAVHTCTICMVNKWVRPPTVTSQWDLVSVRLIISEVHWELVMLWNRSFPFSSLIRYLLFAESLCMVLSFAMWQKDVCSVYLASSSFTLLLKKQLVFFTFSSFFCEVMPFYPSNRFAAVFEWTRTSHTHLKKLYELKINAQTIRGRDMEARGGRGEHQRPFGKVTFATFTCTLLLVVFFMWGWMEPLINGSKNNQDVFTLVSTWRMN